MESIGLLWEREDIDVCRNSCSDSPGGSPHGRLHRGLRNYAAQARRRYRCSARRINEIVHGKRGITADTAMRLSRYFGTTPGFWMNLQMRYELDRAEDALGDTLSGIVPLVTVEVA